MRFGLPTEKRELQAAAGDFLRDRLPLQAAAGFDERGEFPRDLYRMLGELGFLGIPFDEDYGGTQGDALDEAILVEQLGRAMGPLASGFLISVLTCGKAVRDLGTEAQRQMVLPRLSTGEIMIAFALTEPQAGSDAAAITTRATRQSEDGTEWSLSGQKIFCTGATLADYLLVFARTGSGSSGHAGITAFLVDKAAPGVSVQEIPKLGLHPIPSCMIFFDDVVLPESAVLGAVDEGWSYLVASLNRERLAVAAMCTGMAQAALDVAQSYVKERSQFGTVIADFPAVRRHIAQITKEVEGARTLMMHAAHLEIAGRFSPYAASMAKLRASDACVNAARSGMLALGGYSYTMEYPMQRFLRDGLIHPIAAGSNDIQRNIIGQSLLREHRDSAGRGSEQQTAGSVMAHEFADDRVETLHGIRAAAGSPGIAALTALSTFLSSSAAVLSASSRQEAKSVPSGLLLADVGRRRSATALGAARTAGSEPQLTGTAFVFPQESVPTRLLALACTDVKADSEGLLVLLGPVASEGQPSPLREIRAVSCAADRLTCEAVIGELSRERMDEFDGLSRLGAAAVVLGCVDHLLPELLTAADRTRQRNGGRWSGQTLDHAVADIATSRDTAWLHAVGALESVADPLLLTRLSALALIEAFDAWDRLTDAVGPQLAAMADEAKQSFLRDGALRVSTLRDLVGGRDRLLEYVADSVLGPA